MTFKQTSCKLLLKVHGSMDNHDARIISTTKVLIESKHRNIQKISRFTDIHVTNTTLDRE